MFATPCIYKLGYSSSRAILLFYLISWSTLRVQFLYYSLLVSFIRPYFILNRLILGLLDCTNFITPDIYNLGCSTIRIIFLIYFFFLVSYSRPISYMLSYFLGLVYWTMFLGDFWKTCPARCSLALCHGYFRPLPPPLWGSFAARFFFFILLIFLSIFLLLSYTGKAT